MKRFFMSLMGFVFLFSSVHGAPKTDVVVSRDGTDMQVKVVRADWSKVTIMIAGQPQPRPLDKIDHIEFAKKPAPYRQGEKAFQGGFYANAAKFYLKASNVPKSAHFWAKDYGLYKAAISYYYADDFDKATEIYKKIISEGSSRWLAEASMGIIDAYIKKGDVSSAKKEAKKFLSGKSASKMPYYKKMAEFYMAKVFMAEKNYKEASKAYRRVASSTKREFPQINTLAQLGMAQALILNKDFEKAQRKIEDFIAKCPDSVKPSALNALGDCFFEQAKVKSGKDQKSFYEKARWQYLRVFVLYPYSPEALKAKYYTAECFLALSAGEADAKKRAIALQRDIKKHAPKSEWAQKIKSKKKSKKSKEEKKKVTN